MKRTEDRLFLDTAYVQALYSRTDLHHGAANAFIPRLEAAAEIWTTEAVLIEIGNGLSAINRAAAVAFIRRCYAEHGGINLVRLTSPLIVKALEL